MATISTTVSPASQIVLSPDHLGITRFGDAPAESLAIVNRLLQRNHDELHIFFRDMNGHNHLVHNLLTRLALGATPSQLQATFDDDLPTQRVRPPLEEDVVARMQQDEAYLYEHIGQIAHYTNFLVFFERQIAQRGYRAVVNEYVFSGSRVAEAILPLMFDGAYHSVIHLGLGVEFGQPSIVAEALAQAAAHDSFETDFFFRTAEEKARSAESDKSLVELSREVRADEEICRAARTEGFIGTMKMKKCLFANTGQNITSLAAQFRVTPENLRRKTAEMISFCTFLAGATQRAGKKRKIDFFFMHCVTSSILVDVLARQDWIDVASRTRLVEWKGRLDLAWYAVCGVPDVDIKNVEDYEGSPSGGMDWAALFRAVNEQHDDGHVAKFVRALKNGEEVCKGFEHAEGCDEFLVKGGHWLKIGRMAYDSTLDLPGPAKWVVMAGMDKAWAQVPSI